MVLEHHFIPLPTNPRSHHEKKIALLHRMLILGMKCKQTTDLDNIVQLRGVIAEFRDLYMPQ
ncbi:MAG: hypothetical protein RBR67_02395 [Desulfobacterium sp.]|jgi:nickel superoxide dismutase|nr:hypothetical protein [Desulfobacterium sp.]